MRTVLSDALELVYSRGDLYLGVWRAWDFLYFLLNYKDLVFFFVLFFLGGGDRPLPVSQGYTKFQVNSIW